VLLGVGVALVTVGIGLLAYVMLSGPELLGSWVSNRLADTLQALFGRLTQYAELKMGGALSEVILSDSETEL
jgi:hypothetical protein